MAEEIDESGIYREDFSTESDWEVYIAQLGEVCQKWEISSSEWGSEFKKNELFECQWQVKTETLELLKKEVEISYHIAKLEPSAKQQDETNKELEYHKDLMSTLNSFSSTPLSPKLIEIHPLARLYGLRRFIVIHPRLKDRQYLTTMSEFSFFLSAANVVASEVSSRVPIFVQIYDPKWNFFVGVGHGPSMRTNFNLIALDQTPAPCRYLSGLLPMFKEKLKVSHVKPATISVQNIYALDKVRVRIRMYVPFSNVYTYDEDPEDNRKVILSTTEFIALPHGYFRDSYTETFAVYTWPEMAESLALDSALNSVFVPSKAPKGNIFHVAHANSYLSNCLNDFQSLIKEKRTLEFYVGRNFSGSSSAAEAANPLDQLTKTKIVNLRHNRSYTKRETMKRLPGPMNEPELQQMMNFLFPHLSPENCLFPYATNKRTKEFDPLRVKSAKPDSLVTRLSSLLATINSHFGGKTGLAQLWAAFTRELRYCWDNVLYIPGVAVGFPDTRTCLLHQKLQMLNIAIERCAKRQNIDIEMGPKENEPRKESDEEAERKGNETENDDEDDEFYECPDFEQEGAGGDLLTDDESDKNDKATLITEEELIALSNKPEGRLNRLGNLKLLNCDEPLFVPIAQEPVPKTEDQLQDDAEAMLKMGPGSGFTTEMMCSSLLSDMEAFKAANPKAVMEDFIRWYSPKDWEESPDENGVMVGKLSPRMNTPDNTWQLVWNQAKPVPVSRQKRLFDDTKEALNVLYFLENKTISEIYDLTIVPLIHSAILKLKDIFMNCKVLDIFEKQIETLLSDLCYLSRNVEVFEGEDGSSKSRLPSPDRILEKIEQLEEDFYQFKCFERTSGYPECIEFKELKQQFTEFMKNGGSYNILNNKKESAEDSAANNGASMMKFRNELRESLISKDYIIRVDGETTSSSVSSTGAQYLRAIITGDKLRLCTAFSENTTFI